MEEGTIIICQITGGIPGYNGTFAVITSKPDRTIDEMNEFYGGSIDILKKIDMKTECGKYFRDMTSRLERCTIVDFKLDTPNDFIHRREVDRIRKSGLGPLEKIDLYEKEAIRKVEHDREDYFNICRVKT